MKRKTFLICVLILATLLGGCGMKTKENNNKEMYTREEVKQQMLDYLDEKYGEEFDVLDVVYKDWSRNWEKLYAVPKGKGKEYEFMVYRFKDENGEIYYTDDYFIIVKKDEYSEYLKTIIDQYYDEYRFIFYFPWNIEGKTSLDQNISFDEFQKYADEHLVLCVQLFIKEDREDVAEAKLNQLYNHLSKDMSSVAISVFGFNDENYEKNILSKISELDYSIDDLEFKLEIDWDKEG